MGEGTPTRLAVGVIGVGRAGSVLAAALRRAGHPVVAAYAVSEVSRLRADALLPGVPLVGMDRVFADSNLVLIAVPDDVLPSVVAWVADQGWIRPGQFVVHCSGRHGVGVLDPAAQAGALPMALHPVMTFTGTSLDLDRLSGCPFGVTAPASLETAASALVVEMGGEPMLVAEDRRALYHAAVAHAANHLVSLVAEAMDLLGLCGVDEPERMLAPLLGAALDNALASGDQALTGPVARGDAGTVASHLTELSAISMRTASAYRALARLTADRAVASGMLDPAAAVALLAVLADDPGSAL
ncbi:MAG: DUF2520 domain-containing protein [Candidatus Nanopelagicales bacterium]|nr:DUF2520 domain-containing protein [Candidatus Nanopelagicales bacterium]MDZ4249721.1 DUF2520 domain-containing protein [Candidatus Nanopelagicales bacterium]